MTRIAALLQLQEIDTELDTHRQQLQAIDHALDDSQAVRDARQALLMAETQMQTTRTALRGVEFELQMLNTKISEVEERTYSGKVTHPRQLQELQRDLEALSRQRNALEEKQLDAMIKAEAAEISRGAAQTAVQKAENDSAKTQGALLTERATRMGQMEKLMAQRDGVQTSLTADQRKLYDLLRASKKGRAVARYAEGACAACGVELSSALAQTVRQGQHIAQCPNCGRILCAE
jgi:hypothetical protein